MRARPIRAVALVVALASGCASPSPTPGPSNHATVLHLENRISTPVVFGISQRGSAGNSYLATIPACGGVLEVAPGGSGVPPSDWLMGLADDVTGSTEQDIRTWNANPKQAQGPIPGLAIMWATGEINPSDLPRWITVTPSDVRVAEKPEASPFASPCPPWAHPVEPTPAP